MDISEVPGQGIIQEFNMVIGSCVSITLFCEFAAGGFGGGSFGCCKLAPYFAIYHL